MRQGWSGCFEVPYVLPMLAVYISLGTEAIVDIQGSPEASRQPMTGILYDKRIPGGMLSDGLGGVLLALFTGCPMLVFSQVSAYVSPPDPLFCLLYRFRQAVLTL